MRKVNLFIFLIISNFVFSESILFKNASIYTGESAEMLKEYDLLIVDGKISDIRKNITVPADEVLNVGGKIITAGFILSLIHI